jgi:hypothetical protein
MRITAGILAALIIFRIVVFFTAKPKITVDYVAEYNRLSLPDNYNPADNAAELYQKAFDAFIEMPKDLRSLIYHAELTTAEKEQIKNWLASNTKAFDYFRQASEKPYYWIERFSTISPPSFNDITLPEMNIHASMAKATALLAEYNASNGQFEKAFEILLTCYRSGIQKSRPRQLLMDQLLGYRLKGIAVENAFGLLDQYPITANKLAHFQTNLQCLFETDCCTLDMRAETLSILDAVQRSFVFSRKGLGRWAWNNFRYDYLFSSHLSFRERIQNTKYGISLCLTGPTQQEIIAKIENLDVLYGQMVSKTPWQLKNDPFNCVSEIQNTLESHPVFMYGVASPVGIFSRTEALVTALAVLRFLQDSGRYPQSLQELVDAGYLQSLPMDPYSDGPLVYRVTENSFTLYSVGEDFVDNSAVVTFNSGFSPPRRKVLEINYPDIVYWPVYREEDFPAPPVDPNDSTLNGMMPYGFF